MGGSSPTLLRKENQPSETMSHLSSGKWNEKEHFQAAQWSVLSTSCIFMAPAVGLVWYCVILNPTWIAFSSGKPLHIKHDGAIMMFGLQMPLDSDEDHAYNKRPYSFPSKEMVSIKLIAYKDNVHHQSCTYVNLCIHLGQWSYHGQRCLQLQRRHISHWTNH